MEERYENFTTLITRIGRNIRRIKSEEMARLHLKGPHVSCLYYLSQSETMTASELCERCGEDKAAVSRTLDDLEKCGCIISQPSERKRYKSPLRLTEKGREVCRTINERISNIVDAAGAGLGEAERRTMYRALSLISGNLDALIAMEKIPGGAENALRNRERMKHTEEEDR